MSNAIPAPIPEIIHTVQEIQQEMGKVSAVDLFSHVDETFDSSKVLDPVDPDVLANFELSTPIDLPLSEDVQKAFGVTTKTGESPLWVWKKKLLETMKWFVNELERDVPVDYYAMGEFLDNQIVKDVLQHDYCQKRIAALVKTPVMVDDTIVTSEEIVNPGPVWDDDGNRIESKDYVRMTYKDSSVGMVTLENHPAAFKMQSLESAIEESQQSWNDHGALDPKIGFSNLLAKLNPEKPKKLCPIGTVINDLEFAEKEAFEKAFADTSWTSTALHEILISENYSVSYDAVKLHRRGKCICARKAK